MQPQLPNPEHKRMKREKKTIGYLVEIYCKGRHKINVNFVPNALNSNHTRLCALTNVLFKTKKAPVANV